MQHNEFSALQRRLATAALLFLCLWGAVGCGAVHDAALGVGTIQLPPGKLYSEDFYKTATPEDVRKAIGGRSLAGEYYTERSVRDYSGSFLGSGFTKTAGIFIPNTYISEHRKTPLGVALENSDNPGVIETLLKAGADVDGPVLENYIGLAVRRNPKIVTMLLEHSAPVDRCESVRAFAFSGDKALLDYCFAAFPDAGPNCLTKYNGTTPFMYAAMQGNTEIVACMLEKGADLEKTNAHGDKPLDLALHNGHAETARLMLERGADCARLAADGKDLLSVAVMQGGIRDEAVLKRLAARVPLVSDPVDDSAVRAACRSGSTAALKTLLSRGAALRSGSAAYTVDEDAPGKTAMLDFLAAKGVGATAK